MANEAAARAGCSIETHLGYPRRLSPICKRGEGHGSLSHCATDCDALQHFTIVRRFSLTA
jgi:hypothetical protein